MHALSTNFSLKTNKVLKCLRKTKFLHSQYATVTIKYQEPPHDLSQNNSQLLVLEAVCQAWRWLQVFNGRELTARPTKLRNPRYAKTNE